MSGISHAHHYLHKYNDKLEMIDYAINYLKTGINNNETIMLVTDQFSKEEIKEMMQDKGIEDVENRIKDERILIFNTKEVYYPDDVWNTQRIVSNWQKLAANAIKNKTTGLMVFADAWGFFKHNYVKEFIEYESTLPKIFNIPLTGMCSYDDNLFSKLDQKKKQALIKHHHILDTKSDAILICACGVAYPNEYSQCPNCGNIP